MNKIDHVLEDLGVKFLRSGHHHCRPGWVQTDCPFCGKGSGKYHMGWNLSRLQTHCWRCGSKFPDQTLSALTGRSQKECRDILKMVDRGGSFEKKKASSVLKLPEGLGPLLPAHRKYLSQQRGLDPDVMEKVWGFKGLGLVAKMAWRVWIPVHYKGEVVSWTTRSISPASPIPYLSASPEEEVIPHKTILYGIDKVRHSVIVTEGPLDAVKVGPGAVATFGLAFLASQVEALSRIPYRIICFDSERKAQVKANELAEMLSVFPGTTHVVQLDADDPGSASKKEVRLLRKFAKLD